MNKITGDESGATMVEYGLMLACIAIVAAGAVAVFGGGVTGLYDLAVAAFG